MTKFGGLAIALILLVSLAGPLPSAQAKDNPVNLELGGEGATSWNITNIIPGDSGTKTLTLHNAGSVDGFVSLWVSNIISSEGTNPESETGDTGEPGELDQYLLLNMSCSGLDSNISLPTTIDNLPQSAYDPDYIKISPLDVGDTITLDWQWELPAGVGNEVQGDSLSFTINYMLEEIGQDEDKDEDKDKDEDDGPPPGTTDVSGMVSDTCRFLGSLTIISEDGLCRLYIPEGTVGLNWELECVSEITIVIMDEPPPPPENAYVIGLVYDLSPDDATFHPPVSLTISYDPADIPQGVAEKDMVIAYYDEEAGEWVELEGCVVDPATHTITAPVSHFTAFATMGAPQLSSPAAFSVSSLSIQQAEVQPKEAVTITVLVANSGGTAGSYTVVLEINGVKEADKSITIAAGTSRSVSFSVTKEKAGSYSVTVNGLNIGFTVVVPSVPPPEKPFPWLLVGIITGVVAAGLLGFFLFRRSRRTLTT